METKGTKPLGSGALERFSVNLDETQEELGWSLYDFETYLATGQTVLTFFQSPVGANGKTLSDTNMDTAGQIPKGQNMLVEGIEVMFFPGVSSETVALNDLSDDVRAVYEGGFLDFRVGSKSYKREGPLVVYPPQAGVELAAANGGAGVISMASAKGEFHSLIPVRLTSNQNFAVTLTWPESIPLPSGENGRIGVRLVGRLYRNAQ